MGIDAKFGPKEAVCVCCFHNDTGKPNLYVNIEERPGVYHCFVCRARGSFESLVQQYMHWTMPKTAMQCREWARRVANEPSRAIVPPVAQLPQEARLAPFRRRHNYVYERGLIEETALRFDVGYDRSEHAITLPWFTLNGELVGIKRRLIATKYYIFDRGCDPKSTCFGLHLCKQHCYIWLVEGEFDAMYLDQCFRIAHFTQHHAVALGGKALFDKQIGALCRREPHRAVLMLDNDTAGREAQKQIAGRLVRSMKIVEPSYPSDIHDPNKLSFEQVISLARYVESKG